MVTMATLVTVATPTAVALPPLIGVEKEVVGGDLQLAGHSVHELHQVT